MKIRIQPSVLRGTVPAVPSKSMMHRFLICKALAGDSLGKASPSEGDDLAATRAVLTSLFDVSHSCAPCVPVNLDCRDSGSTLRFMLPLVAALGCGGTLTGSRQLAARPIQELKQLLTAGGVECLGEGFPLRVSGKLRSSDYRICGNVSSQYLSGLLMALPLTGGDCTLSFDGDLVSAPYIQLTLEVMRCFGIQITTLNRGWRLKAGQRYVSPTCFSVEGDWSQSAPFLVAAAIGGDLTISGLNRYSLQGDRHICALLAKMGARVEFVPAGVRVSHVGRLQALQADVSQTPDLAPALAVACAVAEGTSHLSGVGRLRLKECDRLEGILQMLERLGVSARYDEQRAADVLSIEGKEDGLLKGGELTTFADHRMVMMGSVAALVANEEVLLEQAPIQKSYPTYFEDYKKLGGKVYGMDIW